MKHYNKFWNWLKNKSSEIETLMKNGQTGSVANLISKELDLIIPDISWEIGVNNDKVELTISAEGNKSLGKILDEMFADCPSIPNWEIYRYKQPKSFSKLSKLIDSQGYHIKLENIEVQVALNADNTRVDIVLISPDFNSVSSDYVSSLSFFILDGILGEKMVEDWIGKINVNADKSSDASISLLDFPKFMSELIEAS